MRFSSIISLIDKYKKCLDPKHRTPPVQGAGWFIRTPWEENLAFFFPCSKFGIQIGPEFLSPMYPSWKWAMVLMSKINDVYQLTRPHESVQFPQQGVSGYFATMW